MENKIYDMLDILFRDESPPTYAEIPEDIFKKIKEENDERHN